LKPLLLETGICSDKTLFCDSLNMKLTVVTAAITLPNDATATSSIRYYCVIPTACISTSAGETAAIKLNNYKCNLNTMDCKTTFGTDPAGATDPSVAIT
jgi:hypothetical protein